MFLTLLIARTVWIVLLPEIRGNSLTSAIDAEVLVSNGGRQYMDNADGNRSRY
jgi:hypothetical protein